MNCTLFSDILKTFNSALPVLEQSPYDFFIKHFLSPIDDSEVYDFAAGLTTSNFSLTTQIKVTNDHYPRESHRQFSVILLGIFLLLLPLNFTKGYNFYTLPIYRTASIRKTILTLTAT